MLFRSSDLAAAAGATIRRWREEPIAFVRENFQVEPDAWQLEALAAFADPAKQRISLQACAGPASPRSCPGAAGTS